jgi:hypothetical protein
MKYHTTAAYVSGAICGHMWIPQSMGGLPHQFDLRGSINRFSDSRGCSFRDILLHELIERGGDFQDARFAADTIVRVERIAIDGNMRHVHVWEHQVSALPDCDDLIHADTYSGNFFEDEA